MRWPCGNPYRGPSIWSWWTWWPYYLRCLLWTRWNRVTAKTLPPTYQEPCELILHCSMALLVRFAEEQADGVDWDWCEDHRHVKAEIDAIHAWWTKGRVAEHAAVDALRDEWWRKSPNVDIDGVKNFLAHPEAPIPKATEERELAIAESNARLTRLGEAEDALKQKDEEMLVRLMKIRGYLWT